MELASYAGMAREQRMPSRTGGHSGRPGIGAYESWSCAAVGWSCGGGLLGATGAFASNLEDDQGSPTTGGGEHPGRQDAPKATGHLPPVESEIACVRGGWYRWPTWPPAPAWPDGSLVVLQISFQGVVHVLFEAR
jgi:hypothetical protein